MELFQHQVEAKLWLLARRRGILADDLRLGKTRSAAAAASEHLPVLVVCPNSVKRHWANEFQAVSPGLRVSVAMSGKHVFPECDVYVVNFDLLVKLFGQVKHVKTFVLDEAHRIKAAPTYRIVKDKATGQRVRKPVNQRNRLCMQLLSSCEYSWALSGTPMPSRPIELWTLLFSMGFTRLGYVDFAKRYAAAWDAPWGFDVSGASNLPELKKLIAPHMLRRTKKQVFGDYVPPEFKLITFDREVDARESEYSLEDLYKHDNPLLAIEGLSEIVKESALRKLPDAVEFIDNILQSEPKVIVFAYHKEVVEGLAIGLKQYNPVCVTGQTPSAKRHGIQVKFNTDPDCRVIIGNILAAGEGTDYSAADVVIFVETTWVPKDIEQASQRGESMRKLGRASSVYFLTTEASLDHYMLRRVLEKTGVINQVISTSERAETMNEAAVVALTRIADALEALLGKKPVAIDVAGAVEAVADASAKTTTEAAPWADTASEPEKKPEAKAEPKKLTEDDLRTLLIAFDEKKGRGSAKALLQKHGANMLKDLAKDKYQAVVDAMEAA